MQTYKKITAHECPKCLKLLGNKTNAMNCCETKQVSAYICTTCGILHIDEKDAKNCCGD